MTHPSREDIAASRKVCEGATPGPWEEREEDGLRRIEAFGRVILVDQRPHDGAFIVHARAALPFFQDGCELLLDENETLRAEIDLLVDDTEATPGSILGRFKALGDFAEQTCGHNPCSAAGFEQAIYDKVSGLLDENEAKDREIQRLRSALETVSEHMGSGYESVRKWIDDKLAEGKTVRNPHHDDSDRPIENNCEGKSLRDELGAWEAASDELSIDAVVGDAREIIAAKDTQIATLTKERDAVVEHWHTEEARLLRELTARRDCAEGNFWYWQGDGEDYPESLTCPVLIRAEDLRALLKERDDAVAALGEIRKEVGRAMPMCYECMRAQEILSRWEATNAQG